MRFDFFFPLQFSDQSQIIKAGISYNRFWHVLHCPFFSSFNRSERLRSCHLRCKVFVILDSVTLNGGVCVVIPPKAPLSEESQEVYHLNTYKHWIIRAGSLDENGPHGHIYLNTWPPVDGTQKPTPLPVSSLGLLLVGQDVGAQPLPQYYAACLLTAMLFTVMVMDSPSETRRPR